MKTIISKPTLYLLFLISLGIFSFKNENPEKYKLFVFQGSDWCSPCIQFEKNVLSDTTLLKKMDRLQIDVERIDFPQRKKQSKEVKEYNASVAEQYKFDGRFPTIILTNHISGKHLKVPVNNNPNSFLELLQQTLVKLQ